MITAVEMHSHLERFLADRDIPMTRLTDHVEEVFGVPRLVVAAGSVIHGFGNPGSDVDVLVLVDNPGVTNFPLSSYDGQQAFDVTYLDTAWAREVGEQIGDGSALACVHEPAGCAKTHETLVQFSRLPLGFVIEAEPEWNAWVSRMRGPALGRILRRWWLLRALRAWTAARIFGADKPWLAAHRYCDAGLALLNARVTAAGEAYFGPKWVAAKLARLDDQAGLAVYERLLAVPGDGAALPSYVDRCEELLESLSAIGPESPQVHLVASYAPGVNVFRANGRTLVSRWMMRGVEFAGPLPQAAMSAGGPIWAGRLTELPSWLRALLVADMAWLGIADWGGHDKPGD
ncbi:hypothetical protein Rhe02_29700 [Rhizocola hellebori]|uniref:Uncharacterized protein n=1 Tax=Rhizocola hellebori TaxID=1392758 RepID=A0A8J3VGH7_9ACTN|nr:hypothetical protein [Rhizocola hellebori]GIH04903.1 hypothetical protein Rhe02_29700 [Rhizocola hellebori]